MIKKIIATSIVAGSMFVLGGCSSVEDLVNEYASDEYDDNIPTVVTTGTSYYIDSAVSGVNYTCGSQEGITGADGSFTFEVGAGCTFYLGDIELRSVAVEELVDGESVVETDITIARVLQSLDSDGNLDNGITIDAEIVTAMAEAGITTLPDTVEELIVFEEVLLANDLALVSAEDAQEHLEETGLLLVLGGKTFYVVGQEVSDATDIWGGEVIFNADLTEITYTEAYGADAGETEVMPINIDGDRLIFVDDIDGSYTVIGENQGDYIEVTDYYSDGTLESNTRFYFDEAKADAYSATLSTVPDTTPDLATLMVGNTFYQSVLDETQTPAVEWIAEMTVNADGTLVIVDNGTPETMDYTIDGNTLTLVGEGVYTLTDVTDTYIEFDSSRDGTWYFTSEDAAASDPVIWN